jgi:hypothetical protein
MEHDTASHVGDSTVMRQGDLPRLTTLHLLIWTAVTAIAIVPYSLQEKTYRHFSPATASATVLTAVGVVGGVAAGTELFVAGATLVWRRRGFLATVEPGQWLAYVGVLNWLAMIATWLIYITWRQSSRAAGVMMSVPRLALGLCVFFWFGWLAFRSAGEPWWRLVFAAIAASPVVSFVIPIVSSVVRPSSDGVAWFTTMMLAHGAWSAAQAAVLIFAVICDVQRRAGRHWSHWFGCAARLLSQSSATAYYLAVWLAPPNL